MQLFTSGSVKVGAGIGNVTHLNALRSQRPMLSGALGTDSEVACVRLFGVSIGSFAKLDNHTNHVILGSNLSIQPVVDADQFFSSPCSDFFQLELQIPLLSELLKCNPS